MTNENDAFETWLLDVLANRASPSEALTTCPAFLVGESIPTETRLWRKEPCERSWEAFGLPCAIKRVFGGVWCGYVGVPSSHPAFDMPYDDVQVEVHWGLTYGQIKGARYWIGFDCAHAGDAIPDQIERPDYHREAIHRDVKRNPKFYEAMEYLLHKLGCTDSRPIAERMAELVGSGEYRDMSFVMAETTYLAKQLASMVR